MQKQATILFADIIGCSEISNNCSVGEYSRIIKQFHETAISTKKAFLSSYIEPDQIEFSLKGDEVCLILHKKDNDLKSNFEDTKKAILFAILLKLNWLLCDYNRRRIENSLLHRDLGIGIHSGPVWFAQFPYNLLSGKSGKSSEGYSINFTKRIEGCSREGKHSKIFISAEAAYLSDRRVIALDEGRQFDLKGISTKTHIFEIKHIDKEFLIKELNITKPLKFPFTTRQEYIRAALTHAKEYWLDTLLFLFFKASNDKKSLAMLATEYSKLASIFDSSERYDEAVEYYNKAIEIEPFWENFYNMGVIYSKQEKNGEAIEFYRKALEFADNYEIRFNMGNAYFRAKKFEDAVACFEKAKVFSKTSDVLLALGECYGEMGNVEKKVAILREAQMISKTKD